MASLILIKHSLPAIVPGLPASQWQLSAEGRARCRPLADAVAHYAPELIFASAEPKAAATAQLLASHLNLGFRVVAGLHEHVRDKLPWLDEQTFAAQVADFFALPSRLVMGAETADQAHTRFAAAVDAMVAAQPGHTLAVVAHGTVISLYVARAAGVEPFSLWQRLGLPSFVVLALPKRTLITILDSLSSMQGP